MPKTKARQSLDEIGLACGTDKATHHGYTRWYAQHLEPLRDEPITLLELGWGGHEDPATGGASCAMWREYFPNATIIGIDIEPKVNTIDGVHFHEGSQADPKFLADLHARYGDFDVIIDDASHVSSLTIRSFELLWPRLKSGGIYAVEDVHMAWHSHYYGRAEANPDPMQPTSRGTETAMQFLKRLADDANFLGRDGSELDLFPRKYWRGYEVESVHFSFNLCVVVKR